MEIDYVYDGACVFEVDGQRVELQHGDAILFDTEAIRSSPISKGADDIVIAITFEREFLSLIHI